MPLPTWRPSERAPQFTEGETSMCAVSHDQEKDDPRKASKAGAGEPQGGKRNTYLSRSCGNWTRPQRPRHPKRFLEKVLASRSIEASARQWGSPGKPQQWAWNWKLQKQFFWRGLVSFALGGSFLWWSPNLVTKQYQYPSTQGKSFFGA